MKQNRFDHFNRFIQSAPELIGTGQILEMPPELQHFYGKKPDPKPKRCARTAACLWTPLSLKAVRKARCTQPSTRPTSSTLSTIGSLFSLAARANSRKCHARSRWLRVEKIRVLWHSSGYHTLEQTTWTLKPNSARIWPAPQGVKPAKRTWSFTVGNLHVTNVKSVVRRSPPKSVHLFIAYITHPSFGKGSQGVTSPKPGRDEAQYGLHRAAECHFSISPGQFGSPQSGLAQEPGDAHTPGVPDGQRLQLLQPASELAFEAVGW